MRRPLVERLGTLSDLQQGQGEAILLPVALAVNEKDCSAQAQDCQGPQPVFFTADGRQRERAMCIRIRQ